MAEKSKEELEKEAKELKEKEAKEKAEKEAAEKAAKEKAEKEKKEAKGLKEATWLFHETTEPKLFEKGADIPEGWGYGNKWGWFKDPNNNFHWRKK